MNENYITDLSSFFNGLHIMDLLSNKKIKQKLNYNVINSIFNISYDIYYVEFHKNSMKFIIHNMNDEILKQIKIIHYFDYANVHYEVSVIQNGTIYHYYKSYCIIIDHILYEDTEKLKELIFKIYNKGVKNE